MEALLAGGGISALRVLLGIVLIALGFIVINAGKTFQFRMGGAIVSLATDIAGVFMILGGILVAMGRLTL